jgi:predicted signal transduction protein with EAL and GGDEF domain
MVRPQIATTGKSVVQLWECNGNPYPSLEHYRQQGVLISMDDFGPGYSGVETPPQLRPDMIKLDSSLLAAWRRTGPPGPRSSRSCRPAKR